MRDWASGSRHAGRLSLLVLVWLVAALAGGLGLREVTARMSCIPRPITHSRSRRHLVLDRPGRARGGRPGRLRGDRAAFLPQAALQLCPRAEQAPRLPPARPRVPVDLPSRQGSRFQGFSRPGLRRRYIGRFPDSLGQGIAIQEGTLKSSFRSASRLHTPPIGLFRVPRDTIRVPGPGGPRDCSRGFHRYPCVLSLRHTARHIMKSLQNGTPSGPQSVAGAGTAASNRVN